MPPRAHRSLAVLTAVMLLAAVPMPVAAARPAPPGPATIDWSGYTWTVKSYNRKIGPGPNFFAAENVSVDREKDDLRLTIQRSGSKWTTAEVIANASLGYGTYTWTIRSAPDFDPNVVLGMFTWDDDPAYAHREIDIEYARWGNAADPTNAQYAVQPWDSPDHDYRWTQGQGLTNTIHSFTWAPGQVDFLSTTSDGLPIASYTYPGADVPVPGGENPRINLWLFRGAAPTNGQPAVVIFDSFRFTPAGG
ncbi:MAG: glycoside hydrolase family 16 protein [Candidatus Limnocylindria bacterium]